MKQQQYNFLDFSATCFLLVLRLAFLAIFIDSETLFLLMVILLQHGNSFTDEYDDMKFLANPMVNMSLVVGGQGEEVGI